MSANSVAGIVELNNVSSDKHNMMAVSYKEMACAGSLCNAAEIDAATLNLPVEHMRIMGDATDQAILRFAEAIGSSTTTRQAWKTVFRIPFNSKDKYMVHVAEPSVTRNSTTNASRERSMTLFIKGAPDILLTKCSTYMGSNGRSAELDALQLAIIDNVKDAWSREAKRVILVARKALSKHLNFMDPQSLEFENAIADQSGQDLELVGMLAMIDPPREEIPDVVRTLRGAGIRVHMVTGDFKLTAQAIAVQCGIITQSSERIDDISALSEFESSWPDSESQEKQASRSIKAESLHRSMVISGADLRNLNEHQWNVLCSYEEIVFARTTPEQKLRIVKELQARGETVGSGSTPSTLYKLIG
jgi:sodium/potassium-transporting ATPase subunit alpha